MKYSDLERQALNALAERTLEDPQASDEHVDAATNRLAMPVISEATMRREVAALPYLAKKALVVLLDEDSDPKVRLQLMALLERA